MSPERAAAAEPAGPVGSGVSVREVPVDGPLPIYANPMWNARFPWLVQGTTGRGDGSFDLSMSSGGPVGVVLDRWRALGRVIGARTLVHSRQVHAERIQWHAAEYCAGILVSDGFDGHGTDAAGVVLTVSMADCVPVALVDARLRAVALLHAGWRGAAAGVLEAGVDALRRHGSDVADLWVHAGPAICGRCYEVGAEVHEQLGLVVPDGPAPVDLRAVLSERARRLGMAPERCSASELCTRCDESFFSHRGGDAGRQVAFLGMRGHEAAPDEP